MQKPILIVAVVVIGLGLMNVARVDRMNITVKPADSIEAQTQMPKNVAAIFHRACRDCHTESTHWPWYTNIAPFQWLITADVYAARDHMNMSMWARYTEQERTDRSIAICEMVAGNKMPLWYYKSLHYPSASLSDADKKDICDWAKAQAVGRGNR